MTRRALLGAVAAALAACSDPGTPGRGAAFSYADTTGGTPIVFHWTQPELPVRYHAQPTSTFPEVVQHHLAAWEAQFLYGELRTTMVAESAHADVVVRFAGPPPVLVPPDTSSTAPACDGVTSAALNTAGDTVERPLVIELQVFGGYAAAEVSACVERVVAHELGHSLGFFSQSHAGTAPTDLMHAPPQVYRPGPRDRATVEVLYHTPRTVVPGPR